MRNAYRAQVPVTVGGRHLTLQFDYEALGAIRSSIGPDKALIAVLQGDRPEMMPPLIAIGLRRHHPEWSAADVAAAAPPYQPMVQAVEEALNAFYFGPGGPPAAAPANPLMRIVRWATKWLRPFGRRSAAASPRPSSGG